MTDKLLPCPFCGGDRLKHFGKEIQCQQCQALGPLPADGEVTRQIATDWWNRRPTPAPVPHLGVTDFANRLFNLHGFMLLHSAGSDGKPTITISFPDLKEAQQFHNTLVELSQHRATTEARTMADLSHLHGLTKEKWIEELESIHENLRKTEPGFEGYGPRPIIEQTGWDAWEGYFNDGYTPQGALDEDRTYWED